MFHRNNSISQQPIPNKVYGSFDFAIRVEFIWDAFGCKPNENPCAPNSSASFSIHLPHSVIHYLRFHRSYLFMCCLCTQKSARKKKKQMHRPIKNRCEREQLQPASIMNCLPQTTAVRRVIIFPLIFRSIAMDATKRCLTLRLSTPSCALCRRESKKKTKSIHIFVVAIPSRQFFFVYNFVRHFYDRLLLDQQDQLGL